MVEPVDIAKGILPAWFIDRMMTDYWTFGLMLDTGKVLVITNIHSVYQAGDGGDIWIDVSMDQNREHCLEPELGEHPSRFAYIFSPTSDRTMASVNLRHVIAAFELAST